MSPEPSDKVKRPHKVLTLQEKLEVVKLNEQGKSHVDIGRQLGVSRSSVSSILRIKYRVLEEVKRDTPMYTKHFRKRDSLVADMEKVLNVWIRDQVRYNIPVSTAVIRAQALDIFNAIKAERGETSKEETFLASKGWFDRFKVRSRLQNMVTQGETAGADTSSAFDTELENSVENGEYTKEAILHEHDTRVRRNKPLKTFFIKEEKTPCEQSGVLTVEELEEGIAMQEKVYAYWVKVDPNFKRSDQVISIQERSIACYRELLKERKRAMMKELLDSEPSSLKATSVPVSSPSNSSSVSSPSNSPSPKTRKRRMCDVSDDDANDDIDELIRVSFS